MSIQKNNIQVGPCNIYVGVSVPTAGNRLQINTTTGVPTSGTHVGATEGETTFNWKPNITEIMCDQAPAAIDAFVDIEAVDVAFNALESTIAQLKNYIANPNYSASVADSGMSVNVEEITFGGSVQVTTTSIAFVSKRRDASGKWVVGQLYVAYPREGLSLPFGRGKTAITAVKFKGQADMTRADGDQIGRLYRIL